MSRSEWWHQLLVIVPDNVEVLDTSVLWISGGYNGEDDDEVAIDSFDVQFMADIAVTNKMTTAILYQGCLQKKKLLRRRHWSILIFPPPSLA